VLVAADIATESCCGPRPLPVVTYIEVKSANRRENIRVTLIKATRLKQRKGTFNSKKNHKKNHAGLSAQPRLCITYSIQGALKSLGRMLRRMVRSRADAKPPLSPDFAVIPHLLMAACSESQYTPSRKCARREDVRHLGIARRSSIEIRRNQRTQGGPM
jgi:hypothetical protein